MALKGSLVGQVEINILGSVLYDLFLLKPNDMVVMSPDKVHGCDLVSGERGAVGSVITWHYTLDGKRMATTQIIDGVDVTTNKIVFKFIGGDLMDIYSAFVVTLHVEPNLTKLFAVWNFEFEKFDPSTPDPTTLMDLLCGIVKDINTYLSPLN